MLVIMFTASLEIPGIDLRLVEDRHIPEVFACVRENLDHLGPWMPWATPELTEEGCRANRRAVLERFARNDGFDAGIFDHGRFIGTVGGRGIMTAAVRKLVDHALITLGLNRVAIQCAVGNVRSRAIPVRLGFVEEGIARQAERFPDGRFGDLVIYSMLAAEWQLHGKP